MESWLRICAGIFLGWFIRGYVEHMDTVDTIFALAFLLLICLRINVFDANGKLRRGRRC